MPKIFRCMLRDGDLPAVGAEDNMLGVRVPPHERWDVAPDDNGIVMSGNGGMSVNAEWRKMFLTHIPRRFNRIVLGARGNNNKGLWVHGDGPFTDDAVAEGLDLRVDSANHALVEPHGTMHIDEFQRRLADTQGQWSELTPENAL